MKRIALFLTVIMIFSAFVVGCGAPANNNNGENGAADTNNNEAPPAEDNNENEEADEPSADGGSDEIVVHVGPEPRTIDPALNTAVDGATLLVHGFEGLMNLDEDGVPVHGQAEDHEVSDDGLTYTFTLKDDLKWSDGEPVTAEDFVYAWNRAIDPETAAEYAYMFDVIEGYDDEELNIEATDEKTLVVKLSAVTPYFLELCAFPTYFPVREDMVDADPDGWAIDPDTYIGNGPYIMTEWAHDSHITYEKNPNYWNVDELGPESIKFLLMEDDNAILAAFQNEEILLADSIPNDEIEAWKDEPEFNIQGQLGTYYIAFNVEKEYLDDPKVRKALTLAIDREFIVTNLSQAGEQPAGAFVPTGLSDADPTEEFRDVGGDYYDPSADAYEANLEEAKEILADAGYADGEGLPTFEYIYNEDTNHEQIGEALQNMWGELGVNVELASQEWSTFIDTRTNGDYEIARHGWIADYNDPISFLDLWVTDGGNNDAQWSHEKYDEIISKVKASSDNDERMELMHEAEDIMFEESLVAPIYYYVDTYLLNEKLDGFYTSPLGYKYFMYSSIKE